jgi:hypothetical protein
LLPKEARKRLVRLLFLFPVSPRHGNAFPHL